MHWKSKFRDTQNKKSSPSFSKERPSTPAKKKTPPAPKETEESEKNKPGVPPWLAPLCTVLCTAAKIISDWFLQRGHH